MNKLLARQIRKHLPASLQEDPAMQPFFAAVEAAYGELESDRSHLEHTLEVASRELNDANEQLRREAEQNLRQLNNQYRQTLELQEGMILCFRREEEHYIHTLCRGQLALRLGWKAELVEGRSLDAFIPPEQRAEVERAYAKAWSGEPCALEVSSGSIAWLARLRPRVEDGKVVEVIVSGIEITALKQLERDLREAKERAERADRAKGEFLAVMSHEIRTPLNAILGFTELLFESEDDPQKRIWLQTLGSSGESLRGLIEDILDFSKIEAGMVELHSQRAVLADMIRAVTAMFAPRASAKGIQFLSDIAPDVPVDFSTDATRLKQVLVNLCGNAVKFTQNGSISLIVTVDPEVRDPRLRKLRFRVQDTGIGIREEQRERIFKPFSQADSSTTRVYGGSGLGLVICQRLVRLMGGDITFTSEPGKGTCFEFSIEVELLTTAAPRQEKTTQKTPERLQVLVVEDRLENRQLMREILNRFGCITEFAENGRLAVDVAAQRPFDLVIMDLQMPEMDGFEATRLIRASEGPTQRSRIIALTASTLSEQHARCRDVGMDAVLTKPLHFEALRAELALSGPQNAALS